MSTKKAPGAGSPIAKRCAFVGHLRNAENIAAEIWVLAPIVIVHARVSAHMICKDSRITPSSLVEIRGHQRHAQHNPGVGIMGLKMLCIMPIAA